MISIPRGLRMSGEVAGRSPIEYLFFGVMDFICLLLAAESLNTLQYRRAVEWGVAGIASVLIGYYWPQIRLKIFRRSARQTEAKKEVDKPPVEGEVYIHHQDHLNHQQLGNIEAAFHAAKLDVALRGPDFLSQAWIAWKQKGHNITWDTVSLQKFVFENGRFRRFAPNESAAFVFGIFIVVKNPPLKGQKTISAGDLKARLLFKLKQGEYDISPGAWVDEPYSSVRLNVGDTRQLLLAVSQSYTSDWKMIANRRTSERDAVSMDYTRDFPLFAEGTLEVNLLHIKSGAIIRTWETRVQWPKDYSLSFTGMKES